MNYFHDTLASRTCTNLVSLRDERPVPAGRQEDSTRLQEIGAQAAKIAHDLNNLLSPILMSLEVFRPHLTESSHLVMLDLARKSTVRAAELAKQILSFAKGVNEEYCAIDPGAIVQEIGAFARATFPESLDIQVIASKDLAPIVGNSGQLHRALLNLCVNARDAMAGGGTLTLRAANVIFDAANIRLPRGARSGRYVLFEVSDTGSGIPKAIREKIFDPFFTTKSAGQGTGLGLASVRSVVESHAGLLSLQTEMGKGTTFRILIPAREFGRPAESGRAEIRVVAD